MPDTTASGETTVQAATPAPRATPARRRAQKVERVEQAKTVGALIAALGLLCTISATFHTYVLEPTDRRVTALESGAVKAQSEMSTYREDAAVTRTRLNGLTDTVEDARADVKETKEDVKEILRELRRR